MAETALPVSGGTREVLCVNLVPHLVGGFHLLDSWPVFTLYIYLVKAKSHVTRCGWLVGNMKYDHNLAPPGWLQLQDLPDVALEQTMFTDHYFCLPVTNLHIGSLPAVAVPSLIVEMYQRCTTLHNLNSNKNIICRVSTAGTFRRD